MDVSIERRELQRQIDALLAKPSLTPSERKQCDLLMSKAANLRSDDERRARVTALAKEIGLPTTEEERAAEAEKGFELYLRTGELSHISAERRAFINENKLNARTYQPETSQTAAVLIPNQWAGAYLDRLKSFVGIREAGANVITTKTGGTWKYPFSDDTANNGERLNETDLVSLANPTVSVNTLNSFRYTAKGVQLSTEFAEDIGFDLSGWLQDMFAKRIGRITNTEFTNGAGGGPAGVLPSITNVPVAATGSTTSVTVADLVAAQNIDAGYLPGAVYMFSPGIERVLKSMVATASGLRIFPEMKDKMLLGYPYVLNTAMPASFTANAKAVVFGNFKRGVLIRETAPLLVVSYQRYAEFGQAYYSLTHRQDCVTTDPNALAVLQQAAS
ncbi:MAG TPA: phage major capsid protein [Candidatus Sulfotelmatobacter sp.]|nr:phage major capsid protein [Candidatus Sulfotelmatobacter sp.]